MTCPTLLYHQSKELYFRSPESWSPVCGCWWSCHFLSHCPWGIFFPETRESRREILKGPGIFLMASWHHFVHKLYLLCSQKQHCWRPPFAGPMPWRLWASLTSGQPPETSRRRPRSPPQGPGGASWRHFRGSPGAYYLRDVSSIITHSSSWDIHNNITKDKLLSLSDHNTETQGGKESMWTMSAPVRLGHRLSCYVAPKSWRLWDIVSWKVSPWLLGSGHRC